MECGLGDLFVGSVLLDHPSHEAEGGAGDSRPGPLPAKTMIGGTRNTFPLNQFFQVDSLRFAIEEVGPSDGRVLIPHEACMVWSLSLNVFLRCLKRFGIDALFWYHFPLSRPLSSLSLCRHVVNSGGQLANRTTKELLDPLHASL